MFTEAHEQLDDLSTLGLSRPELESGIESLAKLEAHAVERRLAFMAAIEELGDGGPSAADVNRSRARRSKKSSAKAAATGKKLADMPNLRKALANGDITEEHADAAAAAAEQTSPEEADDALLQVARAKPADLFAKQSREWAGRHQNDAAKRARLERQRSNREAITWDTAEGMTVLHAEFDPVTGRRIKAAVQKEYDRLWRADGGREGSPGDQRTPVQRRADAVANVLTCPGFGAGSSKRPHPKYLGLVRLDYDRLVGGDGEAMLIDGEPLPQTMVDQIMCDGAIAGAIYGVDGAVLWQGRARRLATDDQWAQLVARDGGCVGCGASPEHCEAHHVRYWEELGPTDIDNLVLACSHDHHLIHHGSHVLVSTETGWQLVRRSAQRRSEPQDRAA